MEDLIKSIDARNLQNIADAIREKTGKVNTMGVLDMPNEIRSIQGGGLDTSDATASADEILQGETAYVDGEKITGTFTIDSELTTQDNLISQIQTALQNKASATGEEVTAETNAYTTKLATLETAITALETELQGKASGGSGGSVETCEVVMILAQDMGMGTVKSYAYTSYSDNEFHANANITNTSLPVDTYTFSNVVVGSVLCITGLTLEMAAIEIQGDVELLGRNIQTLQYAIMGSATITILL